MRAHWLLPEEPFESYEEYREATGENAVARARSLGAERVVETLLAKHPGGDLRAEQYIASLDWGGWHALKLDRIDPPGTPNRRVYLHNPWGSDRNGESGEHVSGAPQSVRYGDPQTGVVAIAYESFLEQFGGLRSPEHR